MDDLFPFLVFIVIALINLVKFVLDKNGKGGKSKPAAPGQNPEKSAPAAIEDFFEKLAGKLEPQPTPVPDWPEGYEQPDYMGEQKAYETMQDADRKPAPEPVAEIIPLPVEEPVSTTPVITHTASLKTALSAMPPMASGLGSIRMPSSQMQSGSIDYSLKSKADLRQAILANVIFSAPRAFDASFENTIAK